MESIITAVISAGAALVGVIIIEIFTGKRTYDRVNAHSKESREHHNKLNDKCAELKNEHTVRSREHEGLAGEHKLLLKHADDLSFSTKLISQRVQSIDSLLKTAHTAEQLRYDNLTDKQRGIKDSVDRLRDFADELQKVNLQNRHLQAQIDEMRSENEGHIARNHEMLRTIQQLTNENEYLSNQLNHQPPQKPKPPRGIDMEL